ncbi:FAD-dependent oxidoreductase [Skermania sp. ID1734]|uniref:hydroxysqualene dehydroxylase n=1 Tax=Skermania sp. ID1734 TaxID=2597516 RepID=UPI00117C89D3|nr:FAD-dependent oxidoreductase [Skermania sp. ID1734]TSD94416.1 FAD-dependent oxidoreductase [Skermania sp. ID1734]
MRQFSRRSFIAGTAGLGLAASMPTVRARASGARRVAVFGGGMSGLVVAHELAERGFSVDVFDARPVLGGKARSFGVPGSAAGGRPELPAEHGFRFFPGFYRNVPDSMRRVPFPGNPDGVLDNLRRISAIGDQDGFGGAASSGPGRSIAGFLPSDAPNADPGRLDDPAYLRELLKESAAQFAVTPMDRLPGEMADFARCVAVYVTSSTQRRRAVWDNVSWWDFLHAAQKSTYFQQTIANMTTMGLVAVKPQICSVSSAGNIVEAFLWNVLLPLPGPDDAPVARFLNGPTSQVWIDPWVSELRRLGVRFHLNYRLDALSVDGARVRGARVVDGSGTARSVDADYFVSAIPVDRATGVLTAPAVLRADPSLEGIRDLRTEWMNGLMIYLRQPLQVARGVLGVLDHPWTLSAVSQAHLWSRGISGYGNGQVNEIVSVDISTWDRPGMTTTTKPARECTREEIFTEVWATLVQRFGPYDPSLAPANLHSWFLDPAITFDGGVVRNAEPLTVQTVGTWSKRPKGPTAIGNLFVAGDWIQTNANVVSMEGANEGGRIVAQAVLDAAGVAAEPVVRYDYYVPPQLDGLKALDAQRLAAGQPNIFES